MRAPSKDLGHACNASGCPTGTLVSKAMGATYVESGSEASDIVHQCSYSGTSADQVVVFIYPSIGSTDFASMVSTDFSYFAGTDSSEGTHSSEKAVSGIGDSAEFATKAVNGAQSAYLLVHQGSSAVKVDATVAGSVTPEQLESIATGIL